MSFAVTRRRPIFAPNSGNGGSLGNNVYKVAYFASITSNSGTITKPTGSTIILDEFAGGVDAYVNAIANGEPTGENPLDANGVEVDVSSLDASGNYTLSGTPASYPVALIYIITIAAKDWANLTTENILVSSGDLQSVLDTMRPLNPRLVSITSSTTPTPNADITDDYYVTALAANATFGAPTGTLVGGQELIYRIKDNGVARTLAFNAVFRASTDLPLPTTTVANKTMYLKFKYNLTDTKWDLLAKLDNF